MTQVCAVGANWIPRDRGMTAGKPAGKPPVARWAMGGRPDARFFSQTDKSRGAFVTAEKWCITGKTLLFLAVVGSCPACCGCVLVLGVQQHEQFGRQLCEQLCEQLREQRP